MKKFSFFLLLFVSMFLPSLSVSAADQYKTEAKQAIAIEASTGKVLYEQDATTPIAINSITNLLTAYLVYEAMEKGQFDLESQVAISDYAYYISSTAPVTNIPLDQRSYTVNELLHASLISSATSATIALAEQVAGSEAAFVDLMKEKVASWGISDAKLVNASGISNEYLGENRHPSSKETDENLLSATDVAIVARRLILDYPQVLDITSQPYFKLDGTSYTNTNLLLKGGSYARNGVDGLKTASGTSAVTTSLENNMRVITVILHTDEGEQYPEKRFTETNNLMNYVHQYFTMIPLVEEGQAYHNSRVSIFNGRAATAPAVANQDFWVVKRNRNQEAILAEASGLSTSLQAPLQKGTEVGTLTLQDTDLIGQGYIADQPSIELVLGEDVASAHWPFSWWNYFVRYVNEKL